MNLTPEEITVLEKAYEILDTKNSSADGKDFNESHDLLIPDALQVIDEVIDAASNSKS